MYLLQMMNMQESLESSLRDDATVDGEGSFS